MNIKKNIAFVLLSGLMLSCYSEAETETVPEPKATMGKKIAGGVIGGLAAGAFSAVLNKILNTEEKFGLSKRKVGAALSVSVILGAFAGYFVASRYGVKSAGVYEKYKEALREVVYVSSQSIITEDLELLNGSYEELLAEVGKLLGRLSKAEKLSKDVRVSIRDESGDWYGALGKANNELSIEISNLSTNLKEKKDVLLGVKESNEAEDAYKACYNKICALEDEVFDILDSREVKVVEDSYEKTVNYGLMRMACTMPYVGIADMLRGTVRTIKAIDEKCASTKVLCLKREESDDRYSELAIHCQMLSKEIATEFPLDLFELRVAQVHSSEAYEKEIEIKDKEIKHKEIVEVLTVIKSELNGIVSNIKGEVSNVRKGMSEVKSGVVSIDPKLKDLRKMLSDLEERTSSGYQEVDDSIVTVANMVTELQNYVVQMGNVSNNKLAQLENIVLQLTSTVSRLEHDVSDMNRKLDY